MSSIQLDRLDRFSQWIEANKQGIFETVAFCPAGSSGPEGIRYTMRAEDGQQRLFIFVMHPETVLDRQIEIDAKFVGDVECYFNNHKISLEENEAAETVFLGNLMSAQAKYPYHIECTGNIWQQFLSTC